MDQFSPLPHDHHLENAWIRWDRYLLYDLHLKQAIEGLGIAGPPLLEICYLIVYAAAPVALVLVYWRGDRQDAPKLLLYYTLGTLLSYACFPWLPSDPPRTIFPGQDMPSGHMLLHSLNVGIVGSYGIHSGVFPSAHVSSAIAAGWGLLDVLKRERKIGIAMLVYGCLVAISTVYGRYHNASDAIAGVAVGTLAAWIISSLRRVPRC
jgi:membrane-associated phospholipid phosphatase